MIKIFYELDALQETTSCPWPRLEEHVKLHGDITPFYPKRSTPGYSPVITIHATSMQSTGVVVCCC